MRRSSLAASFLALALVIGGSPGATAQTAAPAPATTPPAAAEPQATATVPPSSAQAPAVSAPAPTEAAPLPSAPLPTASQSHMTKPGFFGSIFSPWAVKPQMGLFASLNMDREGTYGSDVGDLAGAAYHAQGFLKASHFGIRIEYRLGKTGLVTLEPALDFSNETEQVQYSWTGTRPVPMDNSRRDTYVFGLFVDLPLMFNIPIGTRFLLSLGLGPAFHLRYAIKAAKEVPDANVASTNAWFWASGRYFLVDTPVRFMYRIDDRNSLGVELLPRWPVFNFWAGESYGFLDQGILSVGLTLRRSLP